MTGSSDPARLETLPPDATAGRTCRTPLGSQYLLEHPIGEGSTGRVWSGIRRADGSAVAVKILHAEYTFDPTMVQRFRRESTAVRELRHPHLVPVDDLVVEDDTVAVVMELVNGDDLRRIVQRGGIQTRRAVSLLAQVASALAYIHGAGVLHRDVKPENILVTRRAEPPWALLTDFGLAWVAGARQLTAARGSSGRRRTSRRSCWPAAPTAAGGRLAGLLEYEHGTWWVANTSATRPLSLWTTSASAAYWAWSAGGGGDPCAGHRRRQPQAAHHPHRGGLTAGPSRRPSSHPVPRPRSGTTY